MACGRKVAGLPARPPTIPEHDDAQVQAASTLADLAARGLVREGDKIWISYAGVDGTVVENAETEFVAVSPQAVTIRAGRVDLQVPGASIREIIRQENDSLANGMWMGALVGGGGAAAVLLAGCGGNRDDVCGIVLPASLVYAGIGALVGMGVDALIQRRSVVFTTEPGPRIALDFVPLLGRDARGGLLTVRF